MIVDAAIAYAKAGWPVVPCDGKKPHFGHGSLDATTDENTIRSWWRKWPNANVAIATGSASGLYVVDQDQGGEETIAALNLPPTLEARSGSGGRHFFFKRPTGERWPNTTKKLGRGVDTRGDGGVIVVYPSVHPGTGELYRWVNKLAPAELPESVASVCRPPVPKQYVPSNRQPGEAYAEKALSGECERVASAQEGERNHTLNVAAFSLGQLVATGVISESTVRAELGAAAASAGLDDHEIEQTINSGLAAGLKQPRQIPDRPQTQRSEPAQQQQQQHSEVKSKTRPTPATVMRIFSENARIRRALAFDVQQHSPVVTDSLPWHSSGALPRRLADVDVTRAQQWLELEHGLVCSENIVNAAMQELAERTKYNPIAAWLESLRWDGKERLSSWLHECFGVEDDGRGYVPAVARAVLIAAVARALEPGCKAEHVLVLEGAQGVGKSSGLRALVGDTWFADHMPDFGTREAAMVIGRAWVHELAELATLRRSEVDKIKQFLSQQNDEYRPPWGRNTVVIPRRCVFVATTNTDAYLRDPSGARRFWPVRVRAVDLARIKETREQLWAEAVVAFNKGEAWHLAREVEALARDEQEERAQVDPWETLLWKWAEDKPFVTVDEALHQLGIEPQKRDTAAAMRVGNIFLQKLKWVKRRPTNSAGVREYRFYPGPPLSTDGPPFSSSLSLSLSQSLNREDRQDRQGRHPLGRTENARSDTVDGKPDKVDGGAE